MSFLSWAPCHPQHCEDFVSKDLANNTSTSLSTYWMLVLTLTIHYFMVHSQQLCKMETIIITFVFHKGKLRHEDLSNFLKWQSQDLDPDSARPELRPLLSTRRCHASGEQRGGPAPWGAAVAATTSEQAL